MSVMYNCLFIFILTNMTRQEISDSNDVTGRSRIYNIQVYWNIPTFQCDYHKLNFSSLAQKYNIIMNEGDRFRGNEIIILYDPGNFPAILKNGTTTFLRNGGVPQEGNLTNHLQHFEELLQQLIPNEDFAGIGIIDFESWRPIFRQNFGTLSEYKSISISIERNKYPLWPKTSLEKEAKRRFELFAQQFMEETLLFAKYLRPKATWGYYAYPYCFNMSPNNRKKNCPKEVISENNRLYWLFSLEDNLYPSIYLGSAMTAIEKIQMIEGRIDEAHRLVKTLNRERTLPKIMPYFWYKYHDTRIYVTKGDLFNSFTALSNLMVDGLIIWGSSNDVNTKSKCLQLFQYIDDVLGPTLKNIFNI